MDEMYSESVRRERRMEEILFSSVDPVSKVQHIVDLGFDEEIASEIVERYQIGQRAPVYYERLDSDDEATGIQPEYEEDKK